MPRLAVVLCQYDPDRYPLALAAVRTAVREIAGYHAVYLQVDNAREGDWRIHLAADRIEMGGDNTVHEFSAWRKGLEVFHESYGEAACYLFVTDALLAYGDDYGTLLERSVVDFLVSTGSAAGLIDRVRPGYRHLPLRFLDWTLAYWLRTSFFLLPASVLARVGDLVTIPGMEAFCPTEYRGRAFVDEAPLSEGYRAYLEDWLTGGWHGAFDLSPQTWGRFRDKARSILNEHALTARLGDLGVPIYDLRFLRQRSRANKGRLVGVNDRVLDRYRGDPLAQVDRYRRSSEGLGERLRKLLDGARRRPRRSG